MDDSVKNALKLISHCLAKKDSLPPFLALARELDVGIEALNYNDEKLKFSQIPHLKFAENEVANLSQIDDKSVMMSVYFFGLLGPNAPLPLELSNLIIRRSLSYYDKSLAKFLDIINNRFLHLYFDAWAGAQISVRETKFAKIICAFSGEILADKNSEILENKIPQSSNLSSNLKPNFEKNYLNLRNNSSNLKATLPQNTNLAFARLLKNRTRSEDGLLALLCGFFKLPFKIHSFIPTRHAISKEFLSSLGSKNTSILGQNIQLGTHYYSNTKKILLEIGPINLAHCSHLLPSGKGFERIIALINLFANRPVEHSICFILDKKSNIKTTLNGGFALGINAWLASESCQNPELKITINSYNWAKRLHKGA